MGWSRFETRLLSVMLLPVLLMTFFLFSGTNFTNDSVECIDYNGQCFAPVDEIINETPETNQSEYVDVDDYLNATEEPNETMPEPEFPPDASNATQTGPPPAESNGTTEEIAQEPNETILEDVFPEENETISDEFVDVDELINSTKETNETIEEFVEVEDFLNLTNQTGLQEINESFGNETLAQLNLTLVNDSISRPIIANHSASIPFALLAANGLSVGASVSFTKNGKEVSPTPLVPTLPSIAAKEDITEFGIAPGRYDMQVILSTPDPSLEGGTLPIPVSQILFRDVEITAQTKPVLKLEGLSASATPFGKNTCQAYAIDPTDFNFSGGEISVIARGTELYKCADWIYDEQMCTGKWIKIMDLIPGEEYTVIFNATDPAYAEYNAASGAPRCTTTDSPCIANSSLLLSRGTIWFTSEPNQPNTIDGCTDGSLGFYLLAESVENITIESLTPPTGTFNAGDLVRVTAWVNCWLTGAFDNINLVYANDTSALPWRIVNYSNTCPGGGLQQLSGTFTLDDKSGEHAIRVINQRNGNTADTCGIGNYDDNDDLVFQVNGTPPIINLISPSEGALTGGGIISFEFNVTDSSTCTLLIDGEPDQGSIIAAANTNYEFSASPLSGAHTWAVQCSAATSETRNFTQSPEKAIFEDTFTSGGGFVPDAPNTAPWQRGNATQMNGCHLDSSCAGTNLAANYFPNGPYDDMGTKAVPMNLSNYANVTLTFYHYRYFEDATTLWDAGVVEINNGTGWARLTPEGGYSGTVDNTAGSSLANQQAYGYHGSSWELEIFNISNYSSNENVTFRFYFAADLAVADRGWFIDDVRVFGDPIANETGCFLASAPGATYTLDSDLTNTKSDFSCITVEADNVTIDCAGHKITGNQTNGTIGILLSSADNLLLKNCEISNYTFAVRFNASSHNTMENITIHDNSHGCYIEDNSNYNFFADNKAHNHTFCAFALYNSSHNTFESNIIINASNALYLYPGSNFNLIEYNNLSHNGNGGIYLNGSSYNKIENNLIHGSKYAYNIHYGSNYNNLTDNTAHNTNDTGFEITYSSYNLLVNNTAHDNAFRGFWLLYSSYNTLINNTAYENNISGFSVRANSQHNILSGNKAYGNTGVGFRINYNSTYNNFTDNQAYETGFCGFWINSTSDHNTLINNTARNNSMRGFWILNSSYNNLINNTAYENNMSGFSIRANSQHNILSGNKAYNNTDVGFRLNYNSTYNNFTDNQAYENDYCGFWINSTSDHNNLINNTARNNNLRGFLILNSSYNTLINNNAYGNAVAGFAILNAQSTYADPSYFCGNPIGINITDSNDTIIDDSVACNNSIYGIYIYNSNNTLINRSKTYNNSMDLFVNNTAGYPLLLNITSIVFANPSNSLQNYTNLSLFDSIANSTAYSINWTSQTAPSNYISFASKWINISAQAGTPSIDKVAWQWSDSEASAGGYNESKFELHKYNSSGWSLLNDTPDTSANTLTQYNMNPASDYGILQSNATGCVNFSDPSTYGDRVVNTTDGYYINKNIALCTGTYYLNDSGAQGAIIINSTISIDCNKSTILGNASGYGIYSDGFNDASVFGCNMSGYHIANEFRNAANVTFWNNTINSSSPYGPGIPSGCHFNNVHNSSIFNNTISGLHSGVLLDGSSSNNTILENEFFGFVAVGGDAINIYADSGPNNTISFNLFHDLGPVDVDAIEIQASGTSAYNNSFANLSKGIILMSFGSIVQNVTIYSNAVNSSGFAMGISGSNISKTLIFNNYFNGSVFDDGTANFWNSTYSCVGKNILGGNCSGGNFYPAYTGFDTNGDGIGDLPPYFNITNSSGSNVTADYLPLTNRLGSQCGNISSDTVLTSNVSASGTCFNITADNVTFNCNGYSVAGVGTGYGFLVSNRMNVTLENCDISNFSRAMSLESVNYSYFTNNTLSNNSIGLYMDPSYNNTIIENNAYSNSLYGIFLDDSHNNTLRNNTAYNNSMDGFHLNSSTHNNLTNNTAYNNSLYGFSLFSSPNNKLENNTAYNNTDGIHLNLSNNILITSNNISNNTRHGIYFQDSNYTTVTYNTANGNGEDALRGWASDYALGKVITQINMSFNTGDYNGNNTIELYGVTVGWVISNNIHYPGRDGIDVAYSNAVEILNNNVTDPGQIGLRADQCYNLLVSNNNITFATAAIGSNSLSNSTISYNELSGSTEGIYLIYQSYGNNITHNIAHNNARGIYLRNAHNYTLTNNTIYNSGERGISFWNSTDTAFYNTTLYNNKYDIYIRNTQSTPMAYNMSNTTIRNPSGSLQNYTILSVNDSVEASTTYTINWTTNSSALPTGRFSFRQKFVDITALAGTPSIDEVIWHWFDSELLGYNETLFELWKYNTSGWNLLNNTPNTSSNIFQQYNLTPASIYGIFQKSDCRDDDGDGANYSYVPGACAGQIEDCNDSNKYLVPPYNGLRLEDQDQTYTLCPGTYYINASDDSIIRIDEYNITLDCNGTTMIGNGGGSLVGGYWSEMEIKNCIIYNYSDCMNFGWGENVLIHNNTLSGCSEGLNLGNFKHGKAYENTILQSEYGIYLERANDSSIFNNTVESQITGYYASNQYINYSGEIFDNGYGATLFVPSDIFQTGGEPCEVEADGDSLHACPAFDGTTNLSLVLNDLTPFGFGSNATIIIDGEFNNCSDVDNWWDTNVGSHPPCYYACVLYSANGAGNDYTLNESCYNATLNVSQGLTYPPYVDYGPINTYGIELEHSDANLIYNNIFNTTYPASDDNNGSFNDYFSSLSPVTYNGFNYTGEPPWYNYTRFLYSIDDGEMDWSNEVYRDNYMFTDDAIDGTHSFGMFVANFSNLGNKYETVYFDTTEMGWNNCSDVENGLYNDLNPGDCKAFCANILTANGYDQNYTFDSTCLNTTFNITSGFTYPPYLNYTNYAVKLNDWNTTQQLGPNIIGGQDMGGNFYSDYTGIDANGDGIGETPYPIAGGGAIDQLPLTNNIGGCRIINSSGAYQLNQNAVGAPYNGTPVATYACVKIESSDVEFDCNGYNITNNGTAGITCGVFLKGSLTNVTLKNCPGISQYSQGVCTHDANTSLFTNITSHSNTYGFYIFASYNNTIRNCTAYNSSSNGFYFYLGSHNNTISNSTSYDSLAGFAASYSSNNNTLINNTAFNNSYGFLVSFSSNGSILRSNTARGNTVGMFIDPSYNNSIIENNIYSNSQYGLHLEDSHNNTIRNNTAYNNSMYGIYLNSSTYNNLASNRAHNNSLYGFYLSSSNNNALSLNFAYNNTIAGILTDSSSQNNFENNSVYNNSNYGIYLQSNSNFNTLTNNSFFTNGLYGVHTLSSHNNSFYRNNAYSNTLYGFYLVQSSDNNLTNNTARDNLNYGFFLSSCTGNNLIENLAHSNNAHNFFLSVNSGNNTLFNNTAHSSSGGGGNSGFHVLGSNYNNLTSNTAYNNTQHGFFIQESNFTALSSNRAYNNTFDGIQLLIWSANNTLAGNEAYNNSQNGIWLDQNCSNNTLIGNNAYNNTQNGIHFTQDSNQNNLTGNNVTGNAGIGLSFAATSQSNTAYNNRVCFNVLDISNSSAFTTGTLDTCDSWNTWSEFGHPGCTFRCTEVWQYFYGDIEGEMLLAPTQSDIFYSWNWSGQNGKVYAISENATIDWPSLIALGRNTSQQNSTNDFTELDTLLGISAEPDNVNATYSYDGSNPLQTVNWTLFEHFVPYLPVANSSVFNNGFLSGIAWDSSQAGASNQFSIADNEDVVFTSEINGSALYDYEIRVPASLATYKGGTTVEFWLELD